MPYNGYQNYGRNVGGRSPGPGRPSGSVRPVYGSSPNPSRMPPRQRTPQKGGSCVSVSKVIAVLVIFIILVAIALVVVIVVSNNKKKTFDNVLAVPKDIRIESNKLLWEAVVGADKYGIYIDGNESGEIIENEYDLQNAGLTTGQKYVFQVQARSIANSNNNSPLKDENGNTLGSIEHTWGDDSTDPGDPDPNLTKLDTPMISKQDPNDDKNTTILWDAVSNASGYELRVNNVEVKQIDKSNNNVEVKDYLSTGTNSVQICAVGDGKNYANSDWSNSLSYTYNPVPSIPKLDAPTGLTITDKTLTWNKVVGNSGYNIYDIKDETNPIFMATNEEQDLSSLSIGSYTFVVVALGDGVNYSDSDKSEEKYYEVKGENSQKLDSPTGLSINGSILSWNVVADATAYDVQDTFNGTTTTIASSIANTELELSNRISIAGKHALAVRAVGDGINFSNSEYSSSVEYEIQQQKLNTPSGFAYDDVIRLLTWSAVSGADGYSVDIEGALKSITKNEFDLSAFAVGNHTAKVSATDSSGVYLQSDAAEYNFEIKQQQLNAPTIQLNGYTLSWTKIDNASKYVISIDGTETDVSGDANTTTYNLSGLAIGSTYKIKLKAIDTSAVYSDSSWSNEVSYTPSQTTIPKLSTPNIKLEKNGTRDYITFDAITNAVSYQLFSDNENNQELDAKNGTTFWLDTGFFTVGKSYKLQVIAIGDHTNYDDSDFSNTITYTPSDGSSVDETSPDAVVGRIQKYITKEDWDVLFPSRFGFGENTTNPPGNPDGDLFSYDNFIAAAREMATKTILVQYGDASPAWAVKTTVFDKTNGGKEFWVSPSENYDNYTGSKSEVSADFGEFLLSNNENDVRRELSAFLANISHETTGGGSLETTKTMGLWFNQEVGYDDNGAGGQLGYVAENADYPATPGQSYHGRGPVQLSWNYNYGLISGEIFGDKQVLLDNPSLVAHDGKLAFETALLFWMTPQPPKPSCNQIMLRTHTLTDSEKAHGWDYDFGTTIMIINGGLEGNNSNIEQVRDRGGFYERYAGILKANIQGEQLDTAGKTPLA